MSDLGRVAKGTGTAYVRGTQLTECDRARGHRPGWRCTVVPNRHCGSAWLHTHRHGERNTCIDAHTHGHYCWHVCKAEGVHPVVMVWVGDTSTDNNMDTNPKTSDTIAQHRVTH